MPEKLSAHKRKKLAKLLQEKIQEVLRENDLAHLSINSIKLTENGTLPENRDCRFVLEPDGNGGMHWVMRC